jgi:ribosomal protein L3 glutamine methyltransferase
VTKEQLFFQLVEKLSSDKLFYGHAVIDQEDEAMMVAMHVFKQEVNEVLSSGNQLVSQSEIDSANSIVETRLSTLKPMAYILGEVSFCGFRFKSDERALVPRSPIAELIKNGFQPWLDISQVLTALDLCTGSGCIGLAIAKNFDHIKVDVSDISQKALTLAQENKNLLSANIGIIQSDLFAQINRTYDLIVTNPPYVSDEEYSELPEEFKQEPKLGLTSECSGLKIPVEIMLKASKYLNDNGHLFLEVGYSDEALDKAFPQINIEWIDFLNGGQGVCVFSKQMLLEYQHLFKSFLEIKDVI